MKSQRQAIVDMEIEGQRIADWLLEKARAPSLKLGYNFLDVVDSEEFQTFLQEHREELVERVMRVGRRRDLDQAAFAHGFGFGLCVAGALERTKAAKEAAQTTTENGCDT